MKEKERNDTEKSDKKEKDVKKDKKIGGSKEKEKKPSKEEMIEILKSAELKLSQEKEESNNKLSEINKQLEQKDRLLNNLTNTSKKLAFELNFCKSQLEERLKDEQDRQAKKREAKSLKHQENPLDIVVKVKEKEISNAVAQLDKLKKEITELKCQMDEKGDYNTFCLLENQLSNEQQKSAQLAKEFEFTSRLLAELPTKSDSFCEADKLKYMTEIKKLKNSFKDLKSKSKQDTMEMEKRKNELANLKKDIHVYEDPHGLRKMESELIKQKDEIATTRKAFEEKNNSKMQKMIEEESKLNTSVEMKLRHKSQIKLNKEQENSITINKSSSIVGTIKLKKPKAMSKREKKKENLLFSEIEKSEIEQFLPAKSVQLFEDRYEAMCHAKEIGEKKFLISSKNQIKAIKDVESRIEVNIVNIKEAEQKAKILGFQVSEYKEENKKLTEIIQEGIHNMNLLKKAVSDKESENKSVTNSITQLKTDQENELFNIMNPPVQKQEASNDEEQEEVGSAEENDNNEEEED